LTPHSSLFTPHFAVRVALLIFCALAWNARLLAGPVFVPAAAVDSVMYQDPDPPRPGRVKVFPKELVPLWLQALARPELDMRRLSAANIIEAHRRGMSGLEETVPPLLAVLNRPGEHPIVRLAAAQALVALDAREAAEPLFKAAQDGGIDLRNVIEPALARWGYTGARDVWLARLQLPAEPRRSRLLAIQGLGAVREAQAAARLRELVLAPTTDPILRLEAARALALIRTRGSEGDAKRLLAEAGPAASVARLAATSLVYYHLSAEALELLKRLARDSDPAVATTAFAALYEADPCLAAALARPTAASPDATLRALVVEAVRKCPAVEQVPLLADLTGDPHPQVRVAARKALRELARRPAYGGPVRRAATRLLATSDWRGLAQAVILLTQLDHKAAGPRFLELLKHDRPEVSVTAAWGLRKLALPGQLPVLQRTIEKLHAEYPRAGTAARQTVIELQVVQLAQALGQARYRPAEPLLRRFVPPGGGVGDESRAASIWALGYIDANAAPPDLVEALVERMVEMRSVVAPEDPRVGRMAAVALGRMKARAAEETLRSFYKGVLSNDFVSNVSGWALQQIFGEPLKPGTPVPVPQRGWFLGPAE
jgi:HEAT repeat protein